jgi:hypothetical protein
MMAQVLAPNQSDSSGRSIDHKQESGATRTPVQPPSRGGAVGSIPGDRTIDHKQESGATNSPEPIQPPPSGDAMGLPFGIGAFALVLGTVLLVVGAKRRDGTLKAVGTVSVLAGLLSHASLIGELKIGDLVRMENPKVDLSANSRASSAIAAERLLVLSGFEPAAAALPQMAERIRRSVCQPLETHAVAGGKGIIVIIGGTDRVPLSPRAQRRFESNFGLAEARANAARKQILTCESQPTAVLLWGAGPQEFLDQPAARGRDSGSPTDRRIDIWAVWQSSERSVPKANVKPGIWPPRVDGLLIFGTIVGLAMASCYALEKRGSIFTLALAFFCVLAAVYAFLQGAWPFILVEGFWSWAAWKRWCDVREPTARMYRASN